MGQTLRWIIPSRNSSRRWLPLLGLVGGLAAPARSGAQSTAKPNANVPEFTRQGLLIVNFTPSAGADLKLGRRAGGAVRSRVADLVNKRDTDVIGGTVIDTRMYRSGYDPDASFTMPTVRSVAQYMRADEYLAAWVAAGPAGVAMGGTLILLRDEKLRQLLPTVTANSADSAATLFAQAVAHARTQLVFMRRCENALRGGAGATAVESATEGVKGYPRAVIARTCLVWAQRATGAAASTVLQTAQAILAIDSTSVYALEAGANALDSLKRRDLAADYWLRLAASDTTDIDLAVRVGYGLVNGGSSARAEPFIVRMSARYPDDIRLQQLTFRSAYENRSWPVAIKAAEYLWARDSITRADSSFALRLGIAYQSNQQPFKAIETLARGVASFPRDARLYSLYGQYVRAEADTVIPRGLVLFPRSADLLAMNAKALRASGKMEESLQSTKLAVAIDTSLRQGYLQIAQLELQMARPDSALFALHRGLARGEDSALVAQFALAEGNTRYRAANGSKLVADYRTALHFLAFADSVRRSPQSQFLTGAAALAIAQLTITATAQVTDTVAACQAVRDGAALIVLARSGLEAGRELYAEPARQSLEYLEKLDQYSQQQLRTLCANEGLHQKS